MIEKIILSEKDYECLTKGITIGIGIGTLFGIFINDIVLGFATGGVIGILSSIMHCCYTKFKSVKKESNFKL